MSRPGEIRPRNAQPQQVGLLILLMASHTPVALSLSTSLRCHIGRKQSRMFSCYAAINDPRLSLNDNPIWKQSTLPAQFYP